MMKKLFDPITLGLAGLLLLFGALNSWKCQEAQAGGLQPAAPAYVTAPGTTTPRSVVSRTTDPGISVKDFGAVGDGNTDDTTAIQAALDFAGTNDGGVRTVNCPAGTYRVTKPLWMQYDNVAFQGPNRGSCTIDTATHSDFNGPIIFISKPQPGIQYGAPLVGDAGYALHLHDDAGTIDSAMMVSHEGAYIQSSLAPISAFCVEFYSNFLNLPPVSPGTAWMFSMYSIRPYPAKNIFSMQVNNDGSLWGWATGSGGTVNPRAAASTIAAGVTHHIAQTYDGANVRLFVDGVLKDTKAMTGALPIDVFTDFRFGRPGSYFSSIGGADTWYDSIRISTVARYTTGFTPPTGKLATDANTIYIYNFGDPLPLNGNMVYSPSTSISTYGPTYEPIISKVGPYLSDMDLKNIKINGGVSTAQRNTGVVARSVVNSTATNLYISAYRYMSFFEYCYQWVMNGMHLLSGHWRGLEWENSGFNMEASNVYIEGPVSFTATGGDTGLYASNVYATYTANTFLLLAGTGARLKQFYGTDENVVRGDSSVIVHGGTIFGQDVFLKSGNNYPIEIGQTNDNASINLKDSTLSSTSSASNAMVHYIPYGGAIGNVRISVNGPIRNSVYNSANDATRPVTDAPSIAEVDEYGHTTLPFLDGSVDGGTTQNVPSGRFRVDAGQAAALVMNSQVTAASLVFPVIQAADTTCTAVKNAIPDAGSFVVNLNSACTADTPVGYIINN